MREEQESMEGRVTPLISSCFCKVVLGSLGIEVAMVMSCPSRGLGMEGRLNYFSSLFHASVQSRKQND